jgi:hypothetical protein
VEIIKESWPKNNQVLIEQMSITYLQPNDCCEASEEGQALTISIRDGGGGPFLHIKTEGWSIDSSEDISKLIEDFNSRLKL